MDANTIATEQGNRCECSRYSVLVNLREAEGGDLEWDEELTTGCEATARKLFAQGHDAKLKSFLIKAGVAGHEVQRDEGGMTSVADAATHANRYSFGHMIVAGIERAEGKAAAKAERQAAKVAKRAAGTPTPEVVKAKVGRWVYEGVIQGDEFVYTDSKGNRKTAAKFQLA
ncbi:hypothetical protein [Streptomyces sp. NBC_01518]|uniref:hypothetical protein n=1 Tax=Streptomyces sp. NBC_01518 TaxID=2903891 RepID=UPI00386A7F0E